MACRIGMSKNPEKRIEYWKTKGYTHSKILAKGLTYGAAQEREKKRLKKGVASIHLGVTRGKTDTRKFGQFITFGSPPANRPSPQPLDKGIEVVPEAGPKPFRAGLAL